MESLISVPLLAFKTQLRILQRNNIFTTSIIVLYFSCVYFWKAILNCSWKSKAKHSSSKPETYTSNRDLIFLP